MVCGLWFVVWGLACKQKALRHFANVLKLCGVCGLWFVVCGLWFVVSGLIEFGFNRNLN